MATKDGKFSLQDFQRWVASIRNDKELDITYYPTPPEVHLSRRIAAVKRK